MALMMNKVTLAGRLTDTPELKTTTSGLSVTSFTLAIDRRQKEKACDFISCVAWRGTAEFIAKYFTKGQAIAITGSIQTRKWQDKDGATKYGTDVVVDEAYFVESKKDGTTEVTDEGSLPF